MANELATGEETPQVEILQETPEVASEQPPAVDTPTTPEAQSEPDRGDPRIAMQDERRRRQLMEQNLNDPQFIYEQARKLGLAADETPTSPPLTQPTQQAQQTQTPDIASMVEHQLDYRDAIRNWPDLEKNEGLRMWAASLVNQGHMPSVAADIMQKEISKQASKMASTEVSRTLQDKATSEALKLSADAITSTASASSNSDEEELNAAAKDWKNPGKQEAAILEKLKRGVK